mgnify:CR=1 FL=1
MARNVVVHFMRNSDTHYGLVTVIVHWVVALSFFALFALGYWMVDLGYYDEWYKKGPDLHRSIGILLALLMVFRVIWRMQQVKPKPLATHSQMARKASHITHVALYVLLFVIFISGYLISTADGRGIEVFTWFTVPSLGELFSDQADIAGAVHKYVAYGTLGLVILHMLAAIKHHVIDKDETLMRMLLRRKS